MLDEDVPEEDAGDEELDELDPEDTSTRSASPSKMTARQRARGNKDLQETLLALPNGQSPRQYNVGPADASRCRR